MLTLLFTNALTGNTLVLGPAPWFLIQGGSLRQGPQGHEVASLQVLLWQTPGHPFHFFRTGDATRVAFLDDQGISAGPQGPFSGITVLHNGLWQGPGLCLLLAQLDEPLQSWLVFADNRHYPSVVITPG